MSFDIGELTKSSDVAGYYIGLDTHTHSYKIGLFEIGTGLWKSECVAKLVIGKLFR